MSDAVVDTVHEKEYLGLGAPRGWQGNAGVFGRHLMVVCPPTAGVRVLEDPRRPDCQCGVYQVRWIPQDGKGGGNQKEWPRMGRGLSTKNGSRRVWRNGSFLMGIQKAEVGYPVPETALPSEQAAQVEGWVSCRNLTEVCRLQAFFFPGSWMAGSLLSWMLAPKGTRMDLRFKRCYIG